jgi:two-component system, cell cycle sensor histidine kinase and response regulator CckA
MGTGQPPHTSLASVEPPYIASSNVMKKTVCWPGRKVDWGERMANLSDRDLVNRPTTVLLVEDDAKVRKWIHEELEKRGYNLLEAGDGADALVIAELHSGRIDIVVTDVMMPRVNGPELVKALLVLRPDAKVLYISGYPEEFLRTSTGLPSDDNYLEKPFEMSTLIARIKKLLDPEDGE